MAQKVGYEKLANNKDLQEGRLFKVESDRKAIVLSILSLSTVNATVCPRSTCYWHVRGSLGEPIIEGHNLRSTWNYTIFDVQNTVISDRTVWAKNFVTCR
jgi:hypothetical protein